jgi:hypothetical protein
MMVWFHNEISVHIEINNESGFLYTFPSMKHKLLKSFWARRSIREIDQTSDMWIHIRLFVVLDVKLR